MSEDTPAAAARLGPPALEWAVEITWADWQKAGARGPTSQIGPFTTEEQRDAFLDTQRRDRDVAATRVLTRLAAYSPWETTGEVTPTSEEERERLLREFMASYLPTGGQL